MSDAADGRSRLDRVSEPQYIQDLGLLSLDDLRSRRKEAEKEEQELSYVRRLLHGRIDIMKAEMRRRAGGGEELIASLNQILADAPSTGTRPSQGRFHTAEGPSDDEASRDADLALADTSTANVSSMNDVELREVLDSLLSHEQSVSEGRSQVHRVIDRLSSELTRRYREGTAQVDDLLAAARRQ